MLGSLISVAKGVSFPRNDTTIYRDVVIVGGGAAGTHASITLGDRGVSTLIVEASSQLGGPSQTYHDPFSGVPIDYGVHRFQNLSSTFRFFDRVGVESASDFIPNYYNETVYLDFNAGEILNGFNPGSDWNSYGESIQQYPYLTWGKELPDPVPSDLYLPFSDFVEKYSVQDIVFNLNAIWGGVDMLTVPALDIISGIGLTEIANQEPGRSVRIVGGNEQLYQRPQRDKAPKYPVQLDSGIYQPKVVGWHQTLGSNS